MIQYYNTEAEYEAAAKSAFESQISLVGADNGIHFDGVNVVVGLGSAKTGAACVLDGNSAMHFIAPDTFSSTSFFSNYTYVGPILVGVDHPDFRGTVVVGHKNNAGAIMSYIYSFRLAGYTLDGTDRTGTLRVYSDASNYADYVVSYNADSIAGLVSQLNTFFRDTTNTVFQTQDWVALAVDTDGDSVDDAIDLVFHYTFGKQTSNAGSSGFALTANLFPEIIATTEMWRKNGQRTGEGTIFNMPRAIAYFSQDLESSAYNPTTTQTAANAKRSYPICKPAYLGTSSYRKDGDTQLDYCAAIRAIYGEGEAGWLKFMESFRAVKPTAYGSIGNKWKYGDGKRNTYIMAGRTFVGQDGVSHAVSPAADYCANKSFNHELLKYGCWHLPDSDTLDSIMKTIRYNTTNNRNADPINKTQYAAGGDAISNGTYFWSASRSGASIFWYFYGNGCAVGSVLYGSNRCLPVVLLNVNDSEL